MRWAQVAGVAVLVAVTLFIVTPFVRARSLRARLEVDAAALDTKAWPRVPPMKAPAHDNGFACLADLVFAPPAEMDFFASHGGKERRVLREYLKGAPLDTLPEDAVAQRRAVAPWMDALRACGNSRQLKGLARLSVWDYPPDLGRATMALGGATVLDVREAHETGDDARAQRLCHDTVALLADMTHLGLEAALVASRELQRIGPFCADVLSAAPRPSPAETRDAWAALPGRFASPVELVDADRLLMGVRFFGATFGPKGLPPVDPKYAPPDWRQRFQAASAWPEWEQRMRGVIAGARQSPEALQSAVKKAKRPSAAPFGVGRLIVMLQSDYVLMVGRVESVRLGVEVLAWLAAGAEGAPPAGATRVDGGVEWPDIDGKVSRFSVPE